MEEQVQCVLPRDAQRYGLAGVAAILKQRGRGAKITASSVIDKITAVSGPVSVWAREGEVAKQPTGQKQVQSLGPCGVQARLRAIAVMLARPLPLLVVACRWKWKDEIVFSRVLVHMFDAEELVGERKQQYSPNTSYPQGGQIEGWANKLQTNPVSALQQLYGPMITESCASGSLPADKDKKLETRGRIPDMRAELGGCCVRGGFAPTALHTFSRTEHIMSRYRPIAPKPMAVKPGESASSAASDPQTSSTLSFERSSTKASSMSSDGSRGKRNRKRAGTDSLASHRLSKIPPQLSNCRADRPRTVSCSSVMVMGGVETTVDQLPRDNVARAGPMGVPGGVLRGFVSVKDSPSASYVSQMVPSDTQAMFPIPGQTRVDSENFGSCPGAVGKKTLRTQLVLDSRPGSVSLDPTPRVASSAHKSVPCVQPAAREPAFMDRAAPSAPVFSGRRANGVQKTSGYLGDCAHNMKVASAAVHRSYACGTNGTMADCTHSSQLMEGVYLPAHHSVSNSFAESEVTSGEVAESRRTNLVTLSLLPDTPSSEQTSSEVTTPKSNLPSLWLAMGLEPGNWVADGQSEGSGDLHQLTLFSRAGSEADRELKHKSSVAMEKEKEDSRSQRSYDSPSVEGRPLLETLEKDTGASTSAGEGEEKSEPGRARVIDLSYMEKVYWLSSDPVMLTDEEKNVLWSNQAFRRANTERSVGKDKELVGPYIDPLGIPTQLSSFVYQVPQGPKVRAVLWGFLKKFMLLETSGGNLLPDEGESEYLNGMFRSNLKQEAAEPGVANPHTVIAPQPIRPVGSTLTVSSITRSNLAGPPITDSLESVKEQLEGTPMPAIVTDYRSRVRYVNSAYKQMVGQPECPWLSTVGKKSVRDNAQHSRLTGEVLLTCKENLEHLDAGFSCRVLVQWGKQGKENAMTVSCEVSRLENDKVGSMYVWKLDVPAMGFRHLGGVLRQDAAEGT
ncbi:hypothetical protein R1sor_010429 [Riccia sorocarpa]|uniref:DUF7950 domain-containing protein n=1 Tax=Riccia sorocarpa TaxID=122646 RepID=A0ABD3HYB4_9MARC